MVEQRQVLVLFTDFSEISTAHGDCGIPLPKPGQALRGARSTRDNSTTIAAMHRDAGYESQRTETNEHFAVTTTSVGLRPQNFQGRRVRALCRPFFSVTMLP
jgi:hypothetical protein